MSDSSPSAASTANTVPQPSLFTRAPIKRARPQLSCTPCRQGKLKCNRGQPICDQCTKRTRNDACQYVPPPPKSKQTQNMRGRIRNLESLVVNLINQKEQDAKATEPEEPKPEELNPETFGQLRIGTSSTANYVGAYHWSSLLKEIEDVKTSLEEGDDENEDEQDDDEWCHVNARSSVTYGMPRPISKKQLIEEMPPKEEVDRLLPLWFNSADPLLYIIHHPTFLEEYKQFWKDPSSVSVMWIALLYSALALGIILGPRNPGMHASALASDRPSKSKYDRQDPTDFLTRSVDKFQQLASSALVLADIVKSQPYTLETLMIYGECEFLRRDDHHAKIWLMNGVALRVAMRMGYHRDPSNFKELTPFQGEMRRRAWHVINMMDSLISFAIGLPALVRRIESDVRPPRNLYDADISPSMTETPKGRPLSEITPSTYTIAKCRVAVVFAEAAELSQKITPPRYSTVMALNKRLEEAHDYIPEGMRVRPIEDSITDPPVLIMSRLNIELVYLKTKLVLHRTYLTAGQTDPRFSESRRICVDAAVEILNHHKIIFHACQPGGQLTKVWWYMSSLQTYDYLLAAMILSLELHYLRSSDPKSPRVQEFYDILERTHDIWANHPTRFRESVRGAAILKSMLKKVAAGQEASPSELERNATSQPKEMTPESIAEEAPPEIWDGWPTGTAIDTTVEPNIDMPDISAEIDWTLFDSTMQSQDVMIAQQPWSLNNPTMHSWIGATHNVDYAIANGFQGFDNLQEQLSQRGPTIYDSLPTLDYPFNPSSSDQFQ
ncbi:hypothetical protein P280DRAFT_241496 [Massarina eburnea CBS 473.64]|uniref:Zn(2)-C6 fungal-type domain-containing protein n=1 Tax=Massarina eburnea CBS 473.64 TaxID=1395130 RepID=A0A6A6S704_9PLEO|nr:hypothetical protein P280DRAFT_241496 [Massarina eburnea CBS 473.64]